MFFLNIDKKYRYIIHAVLVSAYIFLASVVYRNESFYLRVILGLILLTISTFYVHYPNMSAPKHRLQKWIMTLILPGLLFGSAMLAYKYYPNLSMSFKLAMLVGVGVLFYIVAIVDNIFLVVSQREEIIPLYRAAIPWSQILLVTIAIPLFAGIFKIPTYSYLQVLVIAVITFVLSFYQFWGYRHEENLVELGVGGKWILSLLCAFFVFTVGISTVFVPFESFLRGLSCAAALMLGLFYVSSFLHNNISQKMLIQYKIILFVFIILGLIF
jgi:hypothetical protein